MNLWWRFLVWARRPLCRVGVHQWRVRGEAPDAAFGAASDDPDFWRQRICRCCRREQFFLYGRWWKVYKER